MKPHPRPRLKITFKKAYDKEYMVLVWEHDGRATALSLEARVPLDDAARARIRGAVETMLSELGDPTEVV